MAITKITNSLVSVNAIHGTLIADNAITSVHIAQNQVTAVQIPDGSITATQLGANSVDSSELVDGSIDTSHIADAQITTAKLGTNQVTSAKIAQNSIEARHIADGSITDTQLGSGAFTMGTITTTGAIRGPASLTIDPATVGDNTGTVVIAGNLQVDGTTTTVNSTTVDIVDKNITLGKGGSASANNGGGITIDGAAATLLYQHSDTSWQINKPLGVTGGITTAGNIVVSGTTLVSDDQTNDWVKQSVSGTTSTLTFGNTESTSGQAKWEYTRSNGKFKGYIGANSVNNFMTIDSSSNVGIGTDSPSAKLDVNVTGNGADAVKITGNSATDFDFVANPPEFNLQDTSSTSGTKRARITVNSNQFQIHALPDDDTVVSHNLFVANLSNGYVGIATSSPTVALQVVGQIKNNNGYLIDNGTNAGFLTVDGSNVNFGSSTAGKGLKFFTAASSNAMTIDSSGNVGIGITSPGSYANDDNSLAVLGQVRIQGVTNTAAVPILALRDTNSGLFAPASNEIGISTAAVERIRIDDTGNVGIGTDTPTMGKLQVHGSKYVNTNSGKALGGIHVSPDSAATLGQFGGAISLSAGGNGSSAIAAVNDGGTDNDSTGLAFFVHSSGTGSDDATEVVRIDELGKVGIGTNAPGVALDIKTSTANTNGVVRIQNNMDNNYEALRIHSLGDHDAQISFLAEGSSTYWGGFGIDYSDAGKFKLQTDNLFAGGSTLMTWARDGKVGIGATNPLTILNVRDSGADIASGDAVEGSTMKGIFLENSVNDSSSLGLWYSTPSGNHQAGVAFRRNDHSSSWGTDIRFFTHENATVNVDVSRERMIVNSEGNLGIGTSSPESRLHISNNAAPANDVTLLTLQNGNESGDIGTPDTFIDFVFKDTNTNVTPQARIAGHAGDGGDANTQILEGKGYLTFHTSDTTATSGVVAPPERMRIHSDGKVSINSTATDAFLNSYAGGTNLKAAMFQGLGGNKISFAPYISNGAFSSLSHVNDIGIFAESASGIVIAHAASGNKGIRIVDNGDLEVGGALSKASGSFKIDHPLEELKDTHHLVHSFVEAPQADNIYRGVVTLVNGSATINLDTEAGMTEGTYTVLNTNTSCFTSNETDWDAVKGSVSGNILTISCQNTSSTATVSWLVIGERHDRHMLDTEWTNENGKVIVEPLKRVIEDE
jgi:hypothetical protein